MNELELRQEAARITQDALTKAAGPAHAAALNVRPVCLIEHRVRRGDVPDGTVLIPMSWAVANQLQGLGLREPVSLTHLRHRWWVAQVDAAHIHTKLEFGGGYCTVVASTEQLTHEFVNGYVEVRQGPFDSQARAAAAREGA